MKNLFYKKLERQKLNFIKKINLINKDINIKKKINLKRNINNTLNIFNYYKIIEKGLNNINKLKTDYKFRYINFNNLYFFNNSFLKIMLKSISIMSKKLGEFFILSPFLFYSNSLSLLAARYIAKKTNSCYLATYKTGILSNLKQTIKKLKKGFFQYRRTVDFLSFKKLSISAFKTV